MEAGESCVAVMYDGYNYATETVNVPDVKPARH